MNHNILITVDGYSWQAVATTRHNRTHREVAAVSCTDVPMSVMTALSDHVINVHDVLELVRHYLNDTGAVIRSATCGPITIEWQPLNPEALRDDLTGMTYAVKLTDDKGDVYLFDTGACNSWQAMEICKDWLNRTLRSSVVVPLGY